MKTILKYLFIFGLILTANPVRATPFDDPHFTPWNHGYEVADAQIETFPAPPERMELKPEEPAHPEPKHPLPENPDHLYRLKPGDRLLLSVYGEPGSRRPVDVDYNGTISYLFILGYPASGKTIQEVRLELEDRLRNYYRSPYLLITLVDSIGEFYTIVGELLDPGIKQLIGRATVLSAIAEAHGIPLRSFRDTLYEIGDLNHAFLSRHGQYVPVNFDKLIREGDMSQNISLRHGDYIFIPSREINQVFILGEVFYPIAFEYLDTVTLCQALAESGGVTRRASSRVAVIRGSLSSPVRYLIDVNRIWKGFAPDFILEPGDIVFVPPMQFTTLKEIVKEGIRAFVSSAANVAGSNAYLQLNPKALGYITSPVPVYSSGAAAANPSVVVVPSTPTAVGGQ